MKSRYEYNGIVWIDLENPSRHEVIDVVNEYGLDTFTAEEMLAPSLRERVEIGSNYVYLILHFPALRHSHKTKEQEVDFVIGENFIITTHYDTIDPLHKFSKIFEVNSVLDMGPIGDHAAYIFFFMLKKLYKSVEHEIEYVDRDLQMIEEHIFSEQHVQMVSAISRAARDLLNLRQTIEPHREVLRSLETDALPIFGEDFRQYMRSLESEYYKVHNHIMRSTESLHELRETNNSLLTTKQNETMRIFTILAFVTFPLSLVTELFSTDAINTPIIGRAHDFWIIIGLEAVATFCMFLYFRRKKWL
ncbi:MAG: hypothetical protein JO019_00495 [Candidatus Kaiserbacteria bacterium]|nr:hypothetical protein [Candidatus Kaiserbacteria bacterium]